MTQFRSDFPVFSGGYTRQQGDPPILLDGMEVLFDRTVGLYAVSLTASPRVANHDAERAGDDSRGNNARGNGSRGNGPRSGAGGSW